MAVLTITDSDIIKTARLDVADATDIADAAFVSGSELAAIEATIKPSDLANLSLRPLIQRGVTKLLAAELLDMRLREDGASGTFQGAGITLGVPLDHPTRLRSEARLALAPFTIMQNLDPVMVAPAVAPSALSVQDKLFGPTEAARLDRSHTCEQEHD